MSPADLVPPVDTSCFQLGAPPDYDDVAEMREEASVLRTMAARARAYIETMAWTPPIAELLLAFGVGKVLALFLIRFQHPVPGGEPDEKEVWIVVGDIPTIFFAAVPRTPAEALELYCRIAEDWADKVLAGGDLSDAFPVAAAPTRGNAEMLKDRLEFIREKFIPVAGAADRIAAEPI